MSLNKKLKLKKNPKNKSEFQIFSWFKNSILDLIAIKSIHLFAFQILMGGKMKKNNFLIKFNFKKNFDQRGQGLIEYLTLVALISVATIGVVKVVGSNLSKKYENINRALGASRTTELKAENASDSSLKQKDLSNFLDGAR